MAGCDLLAMGCRGGLPCSGPSAHTAVDAAAPQQHRPNTLSNANSSLQIIIKKHRKTHPTKIFTKKTGKHLVIYAQSHTFALANKG